MSLSTDRMSTSHNRLVVAAGLCLAVAAGLALFAFGGSDTSVGASAGSATATSPVRIAWEEGAEQMYAVSLASEVSFDLVGGQGPQSLDQLIAGTLNMRVLKAGKDTVEVGFQLAPLRYEVAGQADSDTAARLSTPFVAAFDRSGRAQDFRFPRGLPDRERQQLAEVVRTFQVVVPDGAGREWTTREEHASGRYDAAYRALADGTIQKRKTGYDGSRGAGSGKVLGNTRTTLRGSTLVARLAPDGSWLESAELDESLAVSSGAETAVASVLRATLAAVPFAPDRSLPIYRGADAALVLAAAVPGTGAERTAGTDGQRTEASPAPATEADRAKFQDTLTKLAESDGNDAMVLQALKAQLHRFPELADIIPSMVANRSTSDGMASALLHALQLADTDRAQQALAAVIGDPTHSQMNRVRAIIALGGTEHPAPDAFERLWTVFLDRADPDAADRANTSILAIGRAAGALREDAGDASSGPYEETKARMFEALSTAAGAEDRSVILKALGNTGDPGVAKPVSDYLSSGAPAVRAAAAKALGTLDSAEARGALTARLDRELDGRVRASIAEGLVRLGSVDQTALVTVDRMVAGERDEQARLQMARLLADNLDAYPAGRDTLTRLLETESDKKIRTYVAGKLYAPR